MRRVAGDGADLNLSIPRPPLAIGIAGLVPFIYGAAAAHLPAWESDFAPPLVIIELFGPLLFAYMSGVFWGFVAGSNRTSSRAGWRWLGLAAAPAAFVFLAMLLAPGDTVEILLFAFPALLPIDYLFWRAKMAPRWWLSLRVLLTAIVTICLWLIADGAGFAL